MLDSKLGRLGLRPGQGTVLCSWARHFTFVVLLFTQVCKWGPVNLMLVVTLVMDKHPTQGGVEILLVTGQKNEIQPPIIWTPIEI